MQQCEVFKEVAFAIMNRSQYCLARNCYTNNNLVNTNDNYFIGCLPSCCLASFCHLKNSSSPIL